MNISSVSAIIFVVLLSACPLVVSSESASVTPLDDFETAKGKKLLHISDELKSLLDKHVRPISGRMKKLNALHYFLFDERYLNISYHFNATHTADETYRFRVGNCISHASLFMASARYLGFKSFFQEVDLPPVWQQEKELYVVPGHINVLIKIPGSDVVVEFSDLYDARDTVKMESKTIPDKFIKAEYLNNIGMEHLVQGDSETATQFLASAVEINSKKSAFWSNLGVAYRMANRLEDAEMAYKKAMRKDRNNLSAINNLYLLYRMTDRHEEASRFEKRVSRYQNKNPYYLSRLGNTDLKLGRYEDAVKRFERAIKIEKEDDRFYFGLAKAFYFLNKHKEAQVALTKAKELAEDPVKKIRYADKIKFLLTLTRRADKV